MKISRLLLLVVIVALLSIGVEASLARGAFALGKWVTQLFAKVTSTGVNVSGKLLKSSTSILARNGGNLARGTVKGARYIGRPAYKAARNGKRIVYRAYQRVGGNR